MIAARCALLCMIAIVRGVFWCAHWLNFNTFLFTLKLKQITVSGNKIIMLVLCVVGLMCELHPRRSNQEAHVSKTVYTYNMS